MTEHETQYAIVELLSYYNVYFIETDVMSGLTYFSHKDPRRFAFIAHHKKMGYRKGQPDLILILKGATVYVELKAGLKGKQTPEQVEFQKNVERMGHTYLVWRSVEQAQEYLEGAK